MIKEHLFHGKLSLFNSALDAYTLRQRVIAKNIANSTTPNYVPERVPFEEKFQQAEMVARGERSQTGHIPIPASDDTVGLEVVKQDIPRSERLFSGESNVNIDREMSELAQNQLRFRMVSRLTKKYFDGMQSAIRGTT